MNTGAFTRWLLRAEPGEALTYHTGFLLWDRERDRALSRLADRVMAAQEGGFVCLTQHRLGEGLYAYHATRTEEIAG